jgi:hypothetical protein
MSSKPSGTPASSALGGTPASSASSASSGPTYKPYSPTGALYSSVGRKSSSSALGVPPASLRSQADGMRAEMDD